MVIEMPIDINRIRPERGGDIEEVRRSEIARYRDGSFVDLAVAADQTWRHLSFSLQQAQKQFNSLGEVVKGKKKSSKGADPCTEEVEEMAALKKVIAELQPQETKAERDLYLALDKIGNIVHSTVPTSLDEEDNRVERTWGEPNRIEIDNTPGKYFHHAVLARIDGFDPVRGSKVAGHRGYYLKGPGLLLNQALINYGLHFLANRHYSLVQPPFFMKKSIMALTAELADFDDQLYKVTASNDPNDEGAYLIATSEQPICAMHMGEWLPEKELPIRYGGYSTCFRKEAGAHGKDTWGIFRVHQFEKIEQFVITTPEESWEMHDEMIGTCEEFYQSLQLPYRVIAIVSGALNGAAAKKYDLEAWFPGYNTYRELVSASNCLDFQSRAVEARCGTKKSQTGEKRYVHMLNATLCATERTMCCILENYQTESGVTVPEVLRPFMGGVEFIPFTKEYVKPPS
jgi:seryl-tRNA synthetase